MAQPETECSSAVSYSALGEEQKVLASSSLTTSTLNLIKCIVGAGVLTLPAGVAGFSDDGAIGLALGLPIMLLLCSLSAYDFWLIGRLCLRTEQDTYASAFGCIFGQSKSWMVGSASLSFTVTVSWMYSIIIGDTSRDLMAACGVQGVMGQRNVLLVITTLVLVLPTSLLRSLKSLAPFSALGVLGLVFIALFCGLRFYQGAYSPGGEFYDSVVTEPSFDTRGTRVLPAFVLVSLLTTAFVGHFSAPRFLRELERPSVFRFGVLSGLGFAGAFVVSLAVMSSGFLTFGGSCQGLILNNYATKDDLAIVGRAAILASVIFAYPMVLAACREDLLQLVCQSAPTQSQKDVTTVALLLGGTFVGIVCDNLGFVVAFAGAVLATMIVYVFPALMFIGSLRPLVKAGEASRTDRLEYVLNWGFLCLGALLGLMGAGVTVLQNFFPSVLSA